MKITSASDVQTARHQTEWCARSERNDCALSAESAAKRLKERIAQNVGPFITCSIGFAANRQLAKMACKIDKPNGVTIWHPSAMPAPLLKLDMDEIPGVGSRMKRRLWASRIFTTEALYNIQPKHMRKLWNSVTGERLWYALHGYDVQAPLSTRGMFGHSRVLPPESRTLTAAREICRLLLIKAARRLRRDNFYCSGIWVWLSLKDKSWATKRKLPIVNDDQALLKALDYIWSQARSAYPNGTTVFRVNVTLYDLSPSDTRQLDFLIDDDRDRQRWERVNTAIDNLNAKYGKTVASLGIWNPPAGGHVGGKISYTRIPSAEDFW